MSQGYTECVEQGCTTSMSALGRIYFNGEGIPRDHKLNIQWLRRCIDHGPNEWSRMLLGEVDLAVASVSTAYSVRRTDTGLLSTRVRRW